MQIDAPIIAAFFAGIALVIAALTKAYVTIRAEQKRQSVGLKQIHRAVNSRMTAALRQIRSLQTDVDTLKHSIERQGNSVPSLESDAPKRGEL